MGAYDLISSVYLLYNDDFSIIQGIYIKDKDNNKEELLSELVKDYMSFLDVSIELYEELDIFIESIEKKKIFTFIKMLD